MSFICYLVYFSLLNLLYLFIGKRGAKYRDLLAEQSNCVVYNETSIFKRTTRYRKLISQLFHVVLFAVLESFVEQHFSSSEDSVFVYLVQL